MEGNREYPVRITLTPMSYQKILKLQKNCDYTIEQMVDIAIDYYYDDCQEADEASQEYWLENGGDTPSAQQIHDSIASNESAGKTQEVSEKAAA